MIRYSSIFVTILLITYSIESIRGKIGTNVDKYIIRTWLFPDAIINND